MNITKYIGEFRSDMVFKNYAHSTIESYIKCVYDFLMHFHRKSIHDPKRIPQNEIITYLKESQSVATLKQRIGAIKLFYKHTIGQPKKFRHIEYPRTSKKLLIPLSRLEIQKLISACDNLKHKAIIVLMYSTGMRISEVLNLKTSEDIIRDRMVICIRGGKGNKDRHVPLDIAVLRLLEQYYIKYKPVKYLFEGPCGKYSGSSIRNFLKKYCQLAKIRQVNPHLLRHSFATHLIEDGNDISILQRILGHNSIKTTQAYTYISPDIISKTKSPIRSVNI